MKSNRQEKIQIIQRNVIVHTSTGEASFWSKLRYNIQYREGRGREGGAEEAIEVGKRAVGGGKGGDTVEGGEGRREDKRGWGQEGEKEKEKTRKGRKRTGGEGKSPLPPSPKRVMTHHFVLDVAGAVGVVQSCNSLVHRVGGRADARDKQGLAVPPERILKPQKITTRQSKMTT